METERRGLSRGGGAPVLEVLVRVGVPVRDHRGTQELVVAVCGSPLSPVDWLAAHGGPFAVRHSRRRGEALPRAVYCEVLAPLEMPSRAGMDSKTEGLKEQRLARWPSWVLVPSDSRQCQVWGWRGEREGNISVGL